LIFRSEPGSFVTALARAQGVDVLIILVDGHLLQRLMFLLHFINVMGLCLHIFLHFQNKIALFEFSSDDGYFYRGLIYFYFELSPLLNYIIGHIFLYIFPKMAKVTPIDSSPCGQDP